jgi:hypothetical protein
MQPTSMAPETVSYIVLERRDPTRNMARYYVLSLEPSLFGDTALVRQWGRPSDGSIVPQWHLPTVARILSP